MFPFVRQKLSQNSPQKISELPEALPTKHRESLSIPAPHHAHTQPTYKHVCMRGRPFSGPQFSLRSPQRLRGFQDSSFLTQVVSLWTHSVCCTLGSRGPDGPSEEDSAPPNTDFVSTPGRYGGPKPRPSLVMLVLKLTDGTVAVNVPGPLKPLMCFFVLRTKASHCAVHTPRPAMAFPTQCPGPRDEHILSPRWVEARWVQQAKEWRPEEAPALIPRPVNTLLSMVRRGAHAGAAKSLEMAVLLDVPGGPRMQSHDGGRGG